jgi:cobalt-zinc-cadmium efflux system protein
MRPSINCMRSLCGCKRIGGSPRAGDAGARRQGAPPLALAAGLTFGYAVIEFAGGFWTGSLALLTDASHMATDAAVLLFAFVAGVIARRPASERHSYGLGRVEVIAAFVNALLMLAVVAWVFFEAFNRIARPVSVEGLGVSTIAGIGLLINAAVAWLLAGEGADVNIRAALLHVIGDLLGSVAALAAGLVIHAGGPLIVDPLLSLLFAALILWATFGVLRETTHVLLNGVPPGVEVGTVARTLAQMPGIVAVNELRVWAMVPGQATLSAHVLVDDIERWPVILYRLRHLMQRDFGIDHITLQPEWRRQRCQSSQPPEQPQQADQDRLVHEIHGQRPGAEQHQQSRRIGVQPLPRW